MKKNLLSIISILSIMCISFTSCDDDDPVTKSSYDYDSAIFNFEYSESTIDLNVPGGKNISIESSKVTPMMLGFAHEKMSSYFRGIDMYSNNKMAININMNQMPVTMDATYKILGNQISISLDMASLNPESKVNIPPLSLVYQPSENGISIYADKDLLKVYVINNPMIKSKITELMAKSLIKDYETLPEAAKAGIRGQMDTAINDIFSKINKIEIGAVLKKASSAKK